MNKNLIHPTYFPSVAQFHLLLSAPCLMEVSDNYQKQTYRNRTYIYGANGRQLLTVPILHKGNENGRQLYKDVRIDNAVLWQKNHWKTLETAYRTSPYFEFYEDELRPIFENKHEFLIDLNFETIQTILNCFSQTISWEKTEKYQENYAHTNDFRFVTSAKIPYEVQQENYYQSFAEKHGFLSNLSVLDLLFQEGKHSITYLKNSVKVPLL